MKKMVLVLSCVCLLLVGTACGTSQAQVKMTDFTKLPEPDSVVYIHDGEEERVFQKGTEEFEQILALNQLRLPEETYQIDPMNCVDDLERYDFLVYRYEKKYAPVSFNLGGERDEHSSPATYWVSPQYPPTSFYGFPGSPVDLLAYLNSLK